MTKKSFDAILNLLSANSFRLGGGSTKGFGKIKVREIKTNSFDIDSYENYSSSLNFDLEDNKEYQKEDIETNYMKYILKITPDDFFMFGAGFGDSDADSTPVYEKVVDYDKAKLSDKQILIPASSIKGALAHRTTYHYNLENKLYIGNEDAEKSIKALFGEAKNSKDDITGQKGKILFSDCYQKDEKETKTFDHVAIDRFTGGANKWASFSRKDYSSKG